MTRQQGVSNPPHRPTNIAIDLNSKVASARYLGHVIDNVKRNAEDYEVALDIGCGPGMRDLEILSLLGIRLAIGIDVQTDIERPRPLQMEYIRCDVDDLDLPFTDDSVDFILMNNVIEHLYHPKRVLMECRRCLRREGRLALLTPNQARLINRIRLPLGQSIYFPLEYWLGSGHEHIMRGGQSYFAGHIREYTVDEIKQMLNKSGFTAESVVLYGARIASPREALSKSKALLSLYNLASSIAPNMKYMISVIAKKN